MTLWRQQSSTTAAAILAIAVCGLLPGGSQTTAVAAAPTPTATWTPKLGAGYDTYVHSYYLADNDTTETISEYALSAEISGRSYRRAVHQWLLRSSVSGGSEMFRELLDGSYRWRPGGGDPRLRTDLYWLGRQYRAGSNDSRTSNNNEGSLELRADPWHGDSVRVDVRARGRYVHYATPSTFEQSYREFGGASFLASRGFETASWRVGVRATQRAYADSSALDRNMIVIQGDYDHGIGDADVWLHHRTERRLATDETVRPSAWSHWTEARLALPAGPGHLVANIGNEVWRYDVSTETWFDSQRTDIELGYRLGNPFGTFWNVLLTAEHLGASNSPDAYTQVGLRGVMDSFTGPVTGMLALEYGYREYLNHSIPSTDTLDDLTLDLDYSDFSYLEVWAMASWSISSAFSLEILANYQPEQHTEQDDDTALGYGNIRLVWRP